MGDKDKGPGALHEVLLQPLNTLDVKVVGGFVEKQDIWLSQQELGQFDAHTPSPGQLAGGAVKVCALKTQALQSALHLGTEVHAAHHLEMLLGVAVALAQSHIVLCLVVGAAGHLLLHLLDVLLQLADMVEGQEGLVHHRALAREFHHLRQITDGGASRFVDGAGGGGLQTRHHFHERALPRPILARQCNAVAVVHHKTHVGEQRTRAEFYA